jgi:hypothetical protein
MKNKIKIPGGEIGKFLQLDDNIKGESIDLNALTTTLTFFAPQAATIAFLIQIERLIQQEGSAAIFI